MYTVIRGREFDLEQEDVINAVKGLESGWGRKYAVLVGDCCYPPKLVVLQLLSGRGRNGEPGYFTKLDFTTEDAVRILRKLNFRIVSKDNSSGGLAIKTGKLSLLSGVVRLGGDSVRDSETLE